MEIHHATLIEDTILFSLLLALSMTDHDTHTQVSGHI